MTEHKKTRAATSAEINRYENGEQATWRCPSCGHEVEVLSALMVACATCADERHVLRWMIRRRPAPR